MTNSIEKCPTCGSGRPEGAKFCPSCGTEVEYGTPFAPPPPQPPPGWDRPAGAWGSVGAPASTAPAPPAPASAVPASAVGQPVAIGNELSGWAVALAPLVGLAVSAVIASQAGVGAAVTAGWVVFLGVNCLLTWWDHSVLKRQGVSGVPWVWALFLMPVYLYRRQKHLARGQLLMGVWFVAFVLSIVLQSSVLNAAASHSVSIDTAKLEQEIQAKAGAQVVGGATVSCPAENSVHQGSTFQCILTANSDGSTVLVNVTVENNNGDVIWQVEP